MTTAASHPGLTPAFLTRLAKVLALVASNNDGEALNAARRADALVKGNGLTWCDVIVGPAVEAPSSSLGPPPFDEYLGWREAVRFALERDYQLSAWERNFLHNLESWRSSLSPKQLSILRRVIEKVNQ